MRYNIIKGDSLWKIAEQQLGNPYRWREIAALNDLKEPFLIYLGKQLELPDGRPTTSGGERPTNSSRMICNPELPPPPTAGMQEAAKSINKILEIVDSNPELKGAAVVLEFSGGQKFHLRASNHKSELTTVVHAKVAVPEPADEAIWWDRWSGVVLNCGGVAISGAGIVVGAMAEIPTVGASTVLLVASYTSASATAIQCGLAIGKMSSDDFVEHIQSPEGDWINQADIILDILSLAGGVAGAATALRTGGKVLNASKHAKLLKDQVVKGKLLKTLEKLEKLEKDLEYFRKAVDKLVKSGKVVDPAKRGISNNIIKRAMPYITKSLNREIFSSIADVIAVSVATVSSYYGGVGSKEGGVVKGLVQVTLNVYQQPIEH